MESSSRNLNSRRNLTLNSLPQPRAWILDVGHGNSTVVEAPESVSVIDGGGDDTLVRFLSDKGITYVENVIVSHADADHFGGISLLLSDASFQVDKVYLNPDRRDTALWNDFASVMTDAKKRGTKFSLELNNTNPGHLENRGIRLEVLAPPQDLMYKTVEGRDSAGRRLGANTMSAVVRIWAHDAPRILLTADIDNQGLGYLLNEVPDVRADVLVYPHHGGAAKTSNLSAFARSLLEAVPAQLVVFSIKRGGPYNNPRPEHISTVRESLPNAHIVCTQLSRRCAEDPPTAHSWLHHRIGQGLASYSCCAGTIEVSLTDFSYNPDRPSHQQFISRYASTPMCQTSGPQAVTQPEM